MTQEGQVYPLVEILTIRMEKTMEQVVEKGTLLPGQMTCGGQKGLFHVSCLWTEVVCSSLSPYFAKINLKVSKD